MNLKSFRTLILSAVVATTMFAVAPQETQAAPGDITVMHIFESPLDGRMKIWVVIENEDGTYMAGTIIQGGGFKPGLHWLTGGDDDGDKSPLDLPWKDFPDFPAEARADVRVTQPEKTNTVVVTTDKPVQVQLVDSQKGELIGKLETVETSKTIDISSLPIGCKYMLVIKQDIEGFPVVLPAVNICRMP